jgi:hypothetical protein
MAGAGVVVVVVDVGTEVVVVVVVEVVVGLLRTPSECAGEVFAVDASTTAKEEVAGATTTSVVSAAHVANLAMRDRRFGSTGSRVRGAKLVNQGSPLHSRSSRWPTKLTKRYSVRQATGSTPQR